MLKLKYDFIDAHNGMRKYSAGAEASGISSEGMDFLKEKGYLVSGAEEEGNDGGSVATKLTVAALVEKIKDAATEEDVKALVGDDDRKGVLAAAEQKIKELNAGE